MFESNDLFFISGAALFVVLVLMFISRRRRAPGAGLTVSADSGMGFRGRLKRILGHEGAGDELFSELEVALIEADAGVDVTERLLRSARGGRSADEVRQTIAEGMMEMLGAKVQAVEARPQVILVLGVNGVGKTTTIAKLARGYREGGKKVLLVACDTFRAAAVEQLKEWGSRVGCEVVSQGEGADAAAVAFDGVNKARAKGYDVVILDTAGRLHTKSNLMEELRKIDRVIGRALPGAPHDKLLVIDSTVGANGLSQAREFHKALGLTGVIVTKLDGTAKGGVLLAISGELGIPITHIGVGEKMDDLKPFDPAEYVKTILG
jgi:fused signal recognition particle receptor